MSNLRNTKEFREAVLAAFGVSEDKDVENEENFKRAILDALEVTYTVEDIKNFEKFRHLIVNEVVPAITEGGGGSSDFSTAEVTITNNTENSIFLMLPVVEDDLDQSFLNGFVSVGSNESKSIIVALYKGKAQCLADDLSYPVCTGGVEDAGHGIYIITGNGTITVGTAS